MFVNAKEELKHCTPGDALYEKYQTIQAQCKKIGIDIIDNCGLAEYTLYLERHIIQNHILIEEMQESIMFLQDQLKRVQKCAILDSLKIDEIIDVLNEI